MEDDGGFARADMGADLHTPTVAPAEQTQNRTIRGPDVRFRVCSRYPDADDDL
ncbi:hypothetical protein MHEI_16880 [Mycobacterium heidelbergense]|nr:hypothetical protein MHEI_16880 [Mycobacterium heidelbergense]